ncbi:MAG TPA: tetratricopeptide repeat protein, partial [Polyangiaceae bacterium LLY-WYZ-15_(1-7)]|nr:tetratricopeptide repeat protein [Polyangiaceae bacterium LLY-WYZ-15_(1-7)]
PAAAEPPVRKPAAPPAPQPTPPAPEPGPPEAPDPFDVSVSERASDPFADAYASDDEEDFAFGAAPDLAADLAGAEAAERTPDLAAGEAAGAPEDVDRILSMLQEQKLFEPPTGDAVHWAPKKDAPKTGTKIALPLGVVWVLGIALAAGGWFGWQYMVERKETQAAALVEEASGDAFRGDHKDLIDAERLVRQARELKPIDREGTRLMLFVHAQRALEDGAFEPGYLRPAVDRAGRLELDTSRVKAAEAILAYAAGNAEAGEAARTAAAEAGADDPATLYVVGRLEQRLGEEEAATEHLQAALEAEPSFAAAAIGLAEAKVDEGQPAEALALLDGVLERHEGHLRATLWKAYLEADDSEAEAALASIEALEEGLRQEGAPTDLVLHALTRARLLRRLGRTEDAEAATEAAASAGATEPRLQALVAMASRSLGELGRAQRAAMAAVSEAPAIPEYRKLLAEILVERRDGVRALQTLAQLSNDDPEVLELSARAALIVGGDEALQAAAEALDAHLEGQEEPSTKMQALLIRIRVRTGDVRRALRDARRLARQAAGDADAGLAVAEAALAAREPRLAIDALERVTAAAPDEAEGFFLLGRAQRMAGEAEGAEEAFGRALELQPTHSEARVMLGYLLLDTGQFEEADELYQELARRVGRSGTGRSYALVGRLGRVEALLGLGRVEDAKVQLENVRESDRELPTVKLVEARVALADGRPGDAVSALRPLAQSEGARPDVIALFGDALYAANETRAAAEVYERALGIDEAHPESLLGFATVLLRGNKAREAGEILDRAAAALEARIRPPRLTGQLYTLRGRAALEDGDEGAAREALRAATEIETAPAEAWFYLGEALAGANSPEARQAYETYLEKAPEGPLASRARRAIR